MKLNLDLKYLNGQVLSLTLIIALFGFVMTSSAASIVWINEGPIAFIKTIGLTLVYIVVGIVVMLYVANVFTVSKVFKNQRIFLILIIISMFATLLSPAFNGSKAWIRIGPSTLQPVEFLKVFTIIFLSSYYSRNYNNSVTLYQLLSVPFFYVGFWFSFIVVLQNDSGNAIIVALIAILISFAFPDKRLAKFKKYLFIIIFLFLVIFYVTGPLITENLIQMNNTGEKSHIYDRIILLFDPLFDKFNASFQILNSLVAFNTGGIFGVGLGNSQTKLLLPEPRNDAIIAVIAEELGLIGITFLFVLYFLLIMRILAFSTHKKAKLGDSLVLIGVASFFMIQFLVNIGGMIGLIPMTGVTLLLVSSGGSSIISAFLAIGVALAVIRGVIHNDKSRN